MPKIPLRDEVISDLLSIKGMTAKMLNAVLTHPHIFIGDRDVELPTIPYNYEDECREYTSYSKAQQDMVGYVKEVNEKSL